MSAHEETRNDRARVAEATANAIRDALVAERDALAARVQELETALTRILSFEIYTGTGKLATRSTALEGENMRAVARAVLVSQEPT